MSDYNEKLEQVYDDQITPEDLLSAAGFVVSSAVPDGDINDVLTTMKPVGLISAMQMSGNKNITAAFELGTRTRTLLASKGQKQVMLSKVKTFGSNVLKALYSGTVQVSKSGQIYDLAGDENAHPFGLVISIITESRKLLCHIYFTNAYVEDHTENRTAGERGVMEQVVVKWSNTIVVQGGTDV